MTKRAKDPDQLINAREFRELLANISRETFAKWKKAGILPPPTIFNGRSYWRRSTVRSWLKRQEAAA